MKTIHFSGLPEKLLPGTLEIAPMLSLSVAEGDGTCVTVRHADAPAVKKTNDGVLISWNRPCEFFRMLSYLPGVLDGAEDVSENKRYSLLCYMADQSRNAVFTMGGAKKMLRYLAVLGFDSMMLYTEDTYELPEYPYFGYLRGRWTKEELKALDTYADMLGIELIPCVQMLAHLETALRWPGLGDIHDIDDILMVGEEKTYAYAEAVLRTCAECFRSRRINLGMDEAHNLGRGRYLEKHGYRPSSELMLEHLERIVPMCKKYGFSPMIWSDMFFRMAFGGQYYLSKGDIPKDVRDRVPEGLTLIYWDYYNPNRAVVDHMVKSHKQFHNPTAFAGGAWKWSGFSADNRLSLYVTPGQLDACEEYGLTDIIATGWGDNGGEASQFSNLPSLLYYAERCYHGVADNARLDLRSRACFGLSFADLMLFDAPKDGLIEEAGQMINPEKYLLYNDPLEGIFDRHMKEDAPVHFAENAKRLLAAKDNATFGRIFESLGRLCELLEVKCDLGVRLRRAYRAGDKKALSALRETVAEAVRRLDVFRLAFRRAWMEENRPFGFATQDVRLGGLRTRLIECTEMIDEYLDGKRERIEELDEDILLCYSGMDGKYIASNRYSRMATNGIL